MNTTTNGTLLKLTEKLASDFFPVTLLLGLETIVGCTVSSLVLYMFARYREPSNYRTFVISLCLIDGVCSLTTIPGDIVSHRFWYMYPSKTICKIKDFFNIFTVSTEALCLLLIATERYFLVRSDGYRIGSRLAVALCCLSYIVAALMAIPSPYLWGLRTKSLEVNNTLINATLCEKDAEYEDTNLPEIYQLCIGALIASILIVTCSIYFKIWKLTSSPVHADDAMASMHRHTKIFCGITIFFFITVCLYFTMTSILGNANNVFDHLTNSGKVAYFFFLRFYFIHHVLNPFIYAIYDRIIRYEIKTRVCYTCCERESPYTQII
ncbi:putative G-protein coupled receptor 19 [Mactra antiquata]